MTAGADKDKATLELELELLQGVEQQLHVHMGEPADKNVARQHASNKRAKRARRINRKKK